MSAARIWIALGLAGPLLVAPQALAGGGSPRNTDGRAAATTPARAGSKASAPITPQSVTPGINILYAPSEDDDPAFRAAIAAFTLGNVDYFDGRAATPTLAQLAPYSCVMTWANSSFQDRNAFGDVLADFVDAGNSVVLGAFAAFTSGNSVGGRIMTSGYAPVTGGSNHFSLDSYAGNGTTRIHDGVTSYGATFRDILTLQGSGLQDGSFNDGEIAQAYRPDFAVIYSNGSGGSPVDGNGPDWPLVIANACSARAAATCGAFTSLVGSWGPVGSSCGDVVSAATIATYESESFPTVASDFSVQVDLVATRPNQPSASNTLFVRGTPTPLQTSAQRWNSGYAFNFSSNGKYSIFRYVGGLAIPLQSWVTPVGVTVNGSGLANTLRVDANGGTLTFSINGVAVKTLTGQPVIAGQTGVGMVRSMPTSQGPNDTLVVQNFNLTVGGARSGSASPAAAGLVSPAQARANDLANVRNPNPDPYFDGTGKR